VCPNNTSFQQRYLVCDWSDNVDCLNSDAHFKVNAAMFDNDKMFSEPPANIAELMHPHLQPHLQQAMFQGLSSSENNYSLRSRHKQKIAVSGQGFDLEVKPSSNTDIKPLFTTESVLDYLGDSLSEVARTGSSFLPLIINSWSNHPSY
jgi:hypothetical protein